MRIDIVTLFPELCDGFLSTSILGRARAKNLFEAPCHQMRDYTKNNQKQTADYPYGGGAGMVMQPQPIYDAYKSIEERAKEQPALIDRVEQKVKKLQEIAEGADAPEAHMPLAERWGVYGIIGEAHTEHHAETRGV